MTERERELGVFTPGKSIVRSLWSGPKYNVYLLVWCGSLQFSQQSQNLTTNPHVCKDRWTIGQKGPGRGKALIKKREGGSAGESKQLWISIVIGLLICGPVKLILPYLYTECVKCISIFMCVFQHRPTIRFMWASVQIFNIHPVSSLLNVEPRRLSPDGPTSC